MTVRADGPACRCAGCCERSRPQGRSPSGRRDDPDGRPRGGGRRQARGRVGRHVDRRRRARPEGGCCRPRPDSRASCPSSPGPASSTRAGAGYLLLLDALLNVEDGRALPEAPAISDSKMALTSDVGHTDQSGHTGQSGDSDDLGGEDGEADRACATRSCTCSTRRTTRSRPSRTCGPVSVTRSWSSAADGLWNCHIHTDDVGGAIEAALDAGRPRNIRVTDLEEQVEEERWVREGGSTALRRGTRPGPAHRGGRRRHRRGHRPDLPLARSPLHRPRWPVDEPVDRADPRRRGVRALSRGGAPAEQREHPTGGDAGGRARHQARSRWSRRAGSSRVSPPSSSTTPRATASRNAAEHGRIGQPDRLGRGDAGDSRREGPHGPIEKGDWLGLSRDGIEVVGESLDEVCCDLLEKLIEPRHELVTLIEGEGARLQDTRRSPSGSRSNHESMAVEVHHGGQPLYPYLISIE